MNKAQKIHLKLVDYYGEPTWRSELPPLDELISTILSQNTNDTNRDRAFESLKKEFSTWEEVRDAPDEKIVDAIRVAGLANQKGPRIKSILSEITEQQGSLDLDFLKDMSTPDAYNWLLNFKGVGPKTASIVLLFSLGKSAFPVDTHVHRVSGRLGLKPPKMGADKAHEHLAEQFPQESYYTAHLNLIRLGREICLARRPKCTVCPLQGYCRYYAENRTDEPQS